MFTSHNFKNAYDCLKKITPPIRLEGATTHMQQLCVALYVNNNKENMDKTQIFVSHLIIEGYLIKNNDSIRQPL